MISLTEKTNVTIKIDRLINMIGYDVWEWDKGFFTINDVYNAMKSGQKEELKNLYMKNPNPQTKTREWHIGKVLFYIDNPSRIKNIKIKSMEYPDICIMTSFVDVVKGSHMWMAAYCLYDKGTLTDVTCTFKGRDDVLDYLMGFKKDPPLTHYYKYTSKR